MKAEFTWDAEENTFKEGNAHIRGIIRNEKGACIKNAEVRLFCCNDIEDDSLTSPVSQTVTGVSGEFYFRPLKPGKRYVIQVLVKDDRSTAYNATEIYRSSYPEPRRVPGW